MNKVLIVIKSIWNPSLRCVVAKRLTAYLHRYLFVDAILNLVSPLKLYCPPGAIVGISRWRLRWLYHGTLRIESGNRIVFENPIGKKAVNVVPFNVLMSGRGNELIVQGELRALPTNLCFDGKGNRCSIGARFDVRTQYLHWCLTGTDNVVDIGDDVKILPDLFVDNYQQRIQLPGGSCRVSIGKHSRIMLTVESQSRVTHGFNLSIGENSAIARMYVSTASSCDIMVGKGFFCSWDCYFWNGAHALIDAEGKVLNDIKKIVIGDNVWFGHGVEIPGEIQVADGCVIGSHVTLVKNVPKPGSIVAVSPAKIYPVGVNWVRESPAMVQQGAKWEF